MSGWDSRDPANFFSFCYQESVTAHHSPRTRADSLISPQKPQTPNHKPPPCRTVIAVECDCADGCFLLACGYTRMRVVPSFKRGSTFQYLSGCARGPPCSLGVAWSEHAAASVSTLDTQSLLNNTVVLFTVALWLLSATAS